MPRDGYGPPVLIAVLLFSETTIAKLAGRRITLDEVRQFNDADRVVIAICVRASKGLCS